LDINSNISKDVQLFGTNVGLGLNVTANHLIERSSTFIDDFGQRSFSDLTGEFSFPKWTGRATFTADIDAFRFTWQTRYVGPVEQDAAGIDPFSDAFNFGPNFVQGNASTRAGVIGDTCLGLGSRTGIGALNGRVAGDNTYCRDVGFADAQFYHTASIGYRKNNWTIRAGITNIFNTAPPLVDSSEVLAIGNAAIGAGYDYNGREFFFSIAKKF
jgi:iron complex outermembrane receptor protein